VPEVLHPSPAGPIAPRLIAIDMDGTLLGEDGKVSSRNLAALQAAHSAGIEVVVATGRRHCYAMRVLRPLGLHHGCALISSNGTVTRTLGAPEVATTLIARTYMAPEIALWLCAHIDNFRDALVLTFDRVGADGEDTRGALVVEHLDQLNSSIGRWMAVNEPYIAHVKPIERALASAAQPGISCPDAPIQMMLCGTIERMTRAEVRLLEHPGVAASGHPTGRTGATMIGATMTGAAHRVSRGSSAQAAAAANLDEASPILTLHRTEYPDRDLSILDILPAGCSKGAAVLAHAASRGIAAAEIMAIGDNWNDVSMLEVAGKAVLMDNAPEELKALAVSRGWRIGLSNCADGVAEAVGAALGATR
jgi:hydroxymethylpyrimidine pyrophosphatase-like HAD family hydrolase